jgi:hypothetical protein
MSVPVSVTLEQIKCIEQEDTEPPLIDTEDDEAYVMVMAVNTQGRQVIPESNILLPESLVTRVGPIDIDAGESKSAPANMVWGLDRSPAEMTPRSFLAVSVLENDSADPGVVESRVVAFAQAGVSGLKLNAEAATNLSETARHDRFVESVRKAFDGVLSLANQAIDPDDKIGMAQVLAFTDQELRGLQEQSRSTIERTLRFEGDDALYEVTFAARLFDKTAKRQREWRSCRKCQGLFFGPFGGRCPVGDTRRGRQFQLRSGLRLHTGASDPG